MTRASHTLAELDIKYFMSPSSALYSFSSLTLSERSARRAPAAAAMLHITFATLARMMMK